jgi:1,4-alpha-glucan branching enzyme
MWAHPGKKLLFMGGEFAQWREWNETESLDWHLIENPLHAGVQRMVRDLNSIYDSHSALWEVDSDPAGFQWIDADNAPENIVSFIRRSPTTKQELVCVGNFSAIPREGHRLGLPRSGTYSLIMNSDAAVYAGTAEVPATLVAEEQPHHGQQYSAEVMLPPLSTLWFEAPQLEVSE